MSGLKVHWPGGGEKEEGEGGRRMEGRREEGQEGREREEWRRGTSSVVHID